ncbi:hypothetical protein [Flavobacterium cerinum]|uniref:Uncharacterized protein n=1 Tax=Flavobacterium cerinum TaxID=2502784 RepID=A0A3S4T1Z7_9FLAO|nr:hypothetical protein [Flavobacterium cerinum]RWX00942.1 hypothetical protein EPI11_07930 [Flavobacterium cerinum]
MEQYTTYRVKGKEIGLTFLFKYTLNGDLNGFEVAEGVLEDKQMSWLFSPRFPATESLIKANWINNTDICSKFDISIKPADISFNAMWTIFEYKVGKLEAEKEYKKMKEAEIIECMIAIPGYLKHIRENSIAQIHLCRYISKKRYQDELPTSPKGKNENPLLRNLAYKKTEK